MMIFIPQDENKSCIYKHFYHISLVAAATHEIFIFIPEDENKSCTYRKKLELFVYYIHNFFLFFDI
jgi:hypothetical protein